jgi:hypothetical protein
MKTFVTAVALAGAVALSATAAFAHGPTRQKVTETIEINAPAEKVWAVVGNFQDGGWIPVVEKTTGTDGNTPGKAARTLTLKGGATVEETLDKYDAAAMQLHYRIAKVDVKVLPVNDYSSRITVTSLGADKSKVEWWGAFYRGYMNNDPPPELNDEASKAAVVGLYKAGLENLKKKIEGTN